MLLIVVPLVVLFAIALLPIPKIGKNIKVALLVSSIVALILGGVDAVKIFPAVIKGIDQIAWVAFLAIFGAIFAQAQMSIGSIDTILDIFRCLFGHSTKGLITVIVIALVLAGSLIGSATASACVIGILVISALDELKLDPEHICSILVLGGVLGSIMPPITQAIFLSTSLLKINPDATMLMGYFTTAGGVIITIIMARRFVKIKELPQELIPKEKASQILKREWKKLIPLMIFVVIIILRTAFKIEVLAVLDFFWNIFKPIPILRAFKERMVQAIIIAALVSLCYPGVAKNAGKFTVDAFKSVSETVVTLLFAGIMIGSFTASGMIENIVTFSQYLSGTSIKLGGGAGLILMGMITGSQSTAQTTLVPVLGPIFLNNLGVNPDLAALGFANLATAGQGAPPADVVTFSVVALVAGVLGKKANPLRVMMINLPINIYFALVGFIALFI
jgi:TRAP-type transport system large permease protein